MPSINVEGNDLFTTRIKMAAMRLYFFRPLIGCFVVMSSFWACQNGHKSTACPFGAPQAIFAPDWAGISSHQFKLNGQTGTEQVTFRSGKVLEIVQSGCADIVQEWQMTLPSSSLTESPNPDWIQIAIDELAAISRLHPSLAALRPWPEALTAQKSDITLGAQHVLAPGFWIKVDHIASASNHLLLITLGSRQQ